MEIPITFKPKIILMLLLAVISINVFSLFLSTRLDYVVHNDLYQYGLQFNFEWAEQYWTSSRLFTSSLTIAILVTSISAVFIIIDIRTGRPRPRSIHYLLLFPGLVTTILSVFFFNRLDYVVHNDLYQYGLQFSPEWAVQYWTYSSLILGSVGLVITGTIASITLIFLSKEKLVKINQTKLTYTTLIATGITALTLSTIYTSSILAFIGLGLIFWGTILLYVRTEEYAKKILLDATVLPSIATLNKIIKELDYQGKPIYLPPKYLNNPEAFKVYIPKNNKSKLPTPEQIQEQETRSPINNPQGMLVTPPGAELARLFEKTLQTNFARVDLQWLQQNMPKLFIEDLEIAQNFEMEVKRPHTIFVKMENVAYSNLGKEPADNLSLEHPINSAIACAIAKATGKPVITGSQQTSDDGKTIIIEYHLLNEG